MQNVTFIGTGGFATSLAIHLDRHGRRSVLWGKDENYCRMMAASRINSRHLPGIPIPEDVLVTGDIKSAVQQADLLVAATPTAYLRRTLEGIADAVPDDVPVLSLVKGLEVHSMRRPSEIITDVLGRRDVAVLSGPSHAEEVAQGRPTSLVVASENERLARLVQAYFGSGPLRLYLSKDLVGVELAGALKNIMGVAAGVCDGLGMGDNAKAALMSRGLVEMTRFAVAHGAMAKTFFGLAGVGDLMTTCFSPHGRNRALGRQLAEGLSLEQALGTTANVVEGVFTTRSVAEAARKSKIAMPITESVEKILSGTMTPGAAVTELMSRPSGSEYDDLEF